MVTAACCIIGDEILSGKTKDTNSHYLATSLFSIGIELKSIYVVGDQTDDIARAVRDLSSKYDVVFTSGGIGPTHDDITYESIAAAYQLDMKIDKDTYDYIQHGLKNKKMTDHHARLATFPYPATLLRERENIKIPIVVVNHNIHILPGIPSLFKLLLDSLIPRLQKMTTTRFYRNEIATSLPEVSIAGVLTQAQEKASDSKIKIGSYPLWNNDKIKVVVTVSGQDLQEINRVTDDLTKSIQGWPYQKSRI